MKKKLIIKKRSQKIKCNKNGLDRRIMHTLSFTVLLIAAFSHKSEVRAGSAGRGFVGGALTGAAVGGIAGGGRGAGYGALAGGLLGAAIGGSRSSNGRDPFRSLNKLERKLEKLQIKADKYRANMEYATSPRRRRSKERSLNRIMREIEITQSQINRMQKDLDIRQQPAREEYGY